MGAGYFFPVLHNLSYLDPSSQPVAGQRVLFLDRSIFYRPVAPLFSIPPIYFASLSYFLNLESD